MIEVAKIEGYCCLSNTYAIISPGLKYNRASAKFKILKMPLALIRIGRESHFIFYSKCSMALIIDQWDNF